MPGGRWRRAVAAAVAVTVVGALATGCGQKDDAGDGKDSQEQVRPYRTLYEIPESLAPDGVTVRVGNPAAKTVIHLYEDMRCPVCKQFETGGGGRGVRDLVISGETRVEYTLASFLDDRLGGHGSVKAANALRAALDEGKFVEYHDVLYVAQPEEAVDGFTDAYLLAAANEVQGLRGDAFDAAVKGMKYRSFVTASERAYEASGAPGTPTMKVDGKIVGPDLRDGIFDQQTLPVVVGIMASRS